MYSETTSNNIEGNGLEKMPKKKQTLPRWFLPLLVAMLVTTLAISLPILQQTRIYIGTSGDNITNAKVDTPRVPLISTILQPSYGAGIYTVNVTILETRENFRIENVSSGDFTIVWESNGVPDRGFYTIRIQLIRDNIVRNTFDLYETF